MQHLLSYKLFERSSLTYLGISKEVMQDIQKQLALSDNATWKELKYKKDLKSELQKDNDDIFVIISKDENNVIVIFSINKYYYIDNYKFYNSDDMGDGYWDKEERYQSTITDINKYVQRGSKIYKLSSGNWTYNNRKKRILIKNQKEFIEFTNKFKYEFAINFTKIVKKLYKNNSDIIQKIIIKNLINTNKNIEPEQAKKLLTSNIDRAKQADYYTKRSEEKDPFKLQLQYIRDNSLTIFNEYLISFEDEISKKYNEYLNVPELCKMYSREKIMTAFMYYLYSGKIMEL